MQIILQLIQKRQFTIFCIVALVLGGVVSYFNIPRSEDPGFIIRNSLITIQMPGADPKQIEEMIVIPVEKKLQEISEIEYIRSESRYGMAILKLKILDQYKDIRPIWDRVRRKIDDLKPQLPPEVRSITINDEYGDVFGIVYGISVNNDFNYKEIRDFADTLRNQLLSIPNVAKVNIEGAQEEYIYIEYEASKLAELGIQPEYLYSFINKRNILQSGGVIRTDKENITVEPSGFFQSPEEIKATLVPIPKNHPQGSVTLIPLNNIAKVYRGYQDPPIYKIKLNGVPQIGLAISMSPTGNIVEVSKLVAQTIKKFELTLPLGVEIKKIWSQGDIVDGIISGFLINLLEAIVIVGLVLVCFLEFKAGLLVASMAPIAIIISIFLMNVFDITLNQISIAALIVALGMVVDNSVVLTESIVVKIEEGATLTEAINSSIAQLLFPLFIATSIISLAFLPIYIAPSQVGEYTGQLFTVVLITLSSSLVCSVTFVPTACHYIFQNYVSQSPPPSKFMAKYNDILLLFLRKKTLVITSVVALFCCAMISSAFVKKMFMPKSDLAFFTAEIELPKSAPFNWLENQIQEIEQFITNNILYDKSKNLSGIKQWVTYLGGGGPRYRLVHDPEVSSSNYAFILGEVDNEQGLDQVIKELHHFIHENYPDIKAKIRRLEMGSPVKHPVEIKVYGDDIPTIQKIINDIKIKLYQIKGTVDVSDDLGLPGKKLSVQIHEANSIRSGVSNLNIANSLSALFSGLPISRYQEKDRVLPIVLRSNIAYPESNVFKTTYNVLSPMTGDNIPLLSLADINMNWTPNILLRENGRHYIQAVSNLEGNTTANQVSKEIAPWLNQVSQTWPKDYTWTFEGESKASQDAMNAILTMVPAAFVGIICLILLHFNCIRKTIIVLTTFPLSLIGAIFGLIITGSYFGFMTLLGIIALAGIVFGNSIVLIDRITYEIEHNKLPPKEAITKAAQSRVRPIFLTASSTVLGVAPLWIGGSTLFLPLSIVIVFGLTLATCFTLLVIPVFYAAFFKIKFN